jgi:hypothetical protein
MSTPISHHFIPAAIAGGWGGGKGGRSRVRTVLVLDKRTRSIKRRRAEDIFCFDHLHTIPDFSDTLQRAYAFFQFCPDSWSPPEGEDIIDSAARAFGALDRSTVIESILKKGLEDKALYSIVRIRKNEGRLLGPYGELLTRADVERLDHFLFLTLCRNPTYLDAMHSYASRNASLDIATSIRDHLVGFPPEFQEAYTRAARSVYRECGRLIAIKAMVEAGNTHERNIAVARAAGEVRFVLGDYPCRSFPLDDAKSVYKDGVPGLVPSGRAPSDLAISVLPISPTLCLIHHQVPV